ncbi:MAG: amidase [Gammaproteobacteria bacterium]|nr:amidase [Gammaproteobacteria bacterium]
MAEGLSAVSALHYQDLVAVADAVRSGQMTSESVTAALLERIKALDADLGAYVRVFEEEAMQRAHALDAEQAAGRPLGLLHGVPVAVKDLLAYGGHPTTVGGRVRERWQPAEDATVVRRLKAAGAVILGKLKLTEGAFAEHHPDIQAPRNPWDGEVWTGVSSSGSGVATAAGLCFGSLGTDTGGSIRFPSAACGVVGVKPTYGLVSRFGAFPLAESLDHIGPMTRSVQDAARMLKVLAGYDPQDPNSLDVPIPDYEAEMLPGLAGITLGIDPVWGSAGVALEVSRTVADAAEILAGAGARLREVRMPDARALIDGWAVTCGVEAAMAHAETFPSRRDQYGPVLAALLDLGLRSSATEYAALERERERYRAALTQVFAEVDAVLLPAMPFPPPLLRDLDRLGEDSAAPITFTAPFDYSGSPSVTVPAGFTSEGLPLAFQVVGPALSEARLLRIAHQYELEGPGGPPHPPAYP